MYLNLTQHLSILDCSHQSGTALVKSGIFLEQAAQSYTINFYSLTAMWDPAEDWEDTEIILVHTLVISAQETLLPFPCQSGIFLYEGWNTTKMSQALLGKQGKAGRDKIHIKTSHFLWPPNIQIFIFKHQVSL